MHILLAILISVLVVFVFSLVFAFPVMLLWNWVMVDVFVMPSLSFWQSWGLIMLSGLLFKSTTISKS